MSVRDSVNWVVQPAVLFYWVSQTIYKVEAAPAENARHSPMKPEDKLIDWDYAGLHLMNEIPLKDRLNYHELCVLRRERMLWDPNRKVSQSQEQYENQEYKRLYNAVFSTKAPHLRTSEENYIQFVKDDFFRKQMEPSNPKTSREKYEWYVKKKQLSFFGGKYDFETYLAGNFTARRRRSVGEKELLSDIAGAPNQPTKLDKNAQEPKDLELEKQEEMKFLDNSVNIMKGIGKKLGMKLSGLVNRIIAPNTNDEKKDEKILQEQQDTRLDKKHSLKNIHTQELDPNWIENNAKLINMQGGTKNGLNVKMESKIRSRKLLIRSKRIKREVYDPLINPGAKINRSWALDPRNPWNRNIRYKKHVKLFDAFYVDFFSRTGSDRLPSNETFIKINPPPAFREGLDSRSLSHYVGEMEKLHNALSRTSDITYGVPTKEVRRRERDRNHTAIIKQEELNWNRQMSRIRFLLRKNNITKAKHDRLVADIEEDKKRKYKQYKTRVTKNIVQKGMEQLSWAADFVRSDIWREKRSIRDESNVEESIEDETLRNDKIESNAKEVKVRSKRMKRDIYKMNEILKAKIDSLQMIIQWKLKGVSQSRLGRRKREDDYCPPYNPPTTSEEERKCRRFRAKCRVDYEAAWRHNQVYEDDSWETPPTQPTIPKKTTTLPPEEIKRREEALKNFEADYKMGKERGRILEEEFFALKKSLNRTQRDVFAVKNKKLNVPSVRGKLRKKRYTLEELLKGPPEDKFEQKKTKLEADKQAHEKENTRDKKEWVVEGAANQNKRFYKRNSQGVENDFVMEKNVANSKDDPEHPDNERVDINAYYEQKDLECIADMEKNYDQSLGIRERMYQDYLRIKAQTLDVPINRGAINRMELERAHQERAEYLKRQTTVSTTRIEETEPSFEVLSSFESVEEDVSKPLGKKKLKEKFQELKDLRNRAL